MPETEVHVFREADGSVPFIEWFNEVEQDDPKAYARCVAVIAELAEFGHQMRMPNAKLLVRDIYSLRAKSGKVHYRILYGFVGSHVAMLIQGLTKEDVIPQKLINQAAQRLELAKAKPKVHIAEFTIDDE